MGKWIAGAIKHPGALHKEMGIPAGQKIPKSKLAKAANAGGKEGKRARFAEELEGFNSGKPKLATHGYEIADEGDDQD